MLDNILRRFFGNQNQKKINTYKAIVDKINALEPDFEKLNQEELRGKTQEWHKALKTKKITMEQILPEAFAAVREAAKRQLQQRHFDVQLIGGMVLHDNAIAEMKTGEGKTLVATLPAYLNALGGGNVHIITVNDYLASRDAAWMGSVYNYLGLSVGCIVADMEEDKRKQAYACNIVYGTNNEFAFDYLRDNMKMRIEDIVQSKHHFAIVDEVDSILIDEARTPLIISGPANQSNQLYKETNVLVPLLEDEHYEVEEKHNAVNLTELGNEKVESLMHERDLLQEGSLYDVGNIALMHCFMQSLKAHKLFRKEKDYIVKGGKVIIIDEFTGRMMEGRRYSEGLHQALEAKENVEIMSENTTLASITFQNYFRLYGKLAGMTGTAMTEANEFMDIYKLDVVEIPTNVENKRTDHDDAIYRSFDEKFQAIIDTIKVCHAKKQPVLVGTTSIEKSEQLSERIKKEKIKHNVLNARYHEQEASIIAQAGCLGAVTIATNMAGRGTDIQLGGNLEVKLQEEINASTKEEEKADIIKKVEKEIEDARNQIIQAGGLFIIGTERHESRRIDNQLRGRSGRQGDVGETKFFLSLEDDLMRIFGGEKIDAIMGKIGVSEGEVISHPWISKAIEKSQTKVEATHFEMRKNILKYDDVINYQRKVIFEQRQDIMKSASVVNNITDMRHRTIVNFIEKAIGNIAYKEQWDVESIKHEAKEILGMDEQNIDNLIAQEGIDKEKLIKEIFVISSDRAAHRALEFGANLMRQLEKGILLEVLDNLWQNNIQNLEFLRQSVGLHGYGQRDPLNEFKTEAVILFENLLSNLDRQVTQAVLNFSLPEKQDKELEEVPNVVLESLNDPIDDEVDSENRIPSAPHTWGKVKRNEPCPCASGKKYKHCHGRLD